MISLFFNSITLFDLFFLGLDGQQDEFSDTSFVHLLCLFVEKPTVINVGIYVNSIGPVSSIDMVSQGIIPAFPPP